MGHYQKGDDALHEACINGTLESVKRMVHSGEFYIDCESRNRSTPLGSVAAKLYRFGWKDLDSSAVIGYEEKIKFLLENGADPFEWFNGVYGEPIAAVILEAGIVISQEHRKFPIIHGRDKNIFNLMLNFIGDINTPLTFLGDTALLFAIRRGFFKTTKKLLSMNADVNKRNNFKQTPLHLAVSSRRIKFIDLLIKHGGNMEKRNILGETPLHVSCYYPYDKEIIKKCMKHNSLYSKARKDYTPMHTLVSRSRKKPAEAGDIVELFLDAGFHLETEDLRGRTPLYLSFKKNVEPLASIFLRNGAHLEISSDDAVLLLDYIPLKETDEMSRTILKFIALEVSKGIPMNEKLKDGLSERQEVNHYLKTCHEEINMLKSMRIENTTVNYWSLLSKSIRQIALYAQNNIIAEEISKLEVSTYPIYGQDILYKFAKGKQRLELTIESANILNILWEWKLPSVFSDMVIDRLSVSDMDNVKGVGRYIGLK